MPLSRNVIGDKGSISPRLRRDLAGRSSSTHKSIPSTFRLSKCPSYSHQGYRIHRRVLHQGCGALFWGSFRTVALATVRVLPFCALGVSCCVGRAGLPLGCTLHGLLQRTVPRVAWLCLGCALTRALLGRRCCVVSGSLSCPGCVSGPSAFSWFPVPWVFLAVSPGRRISLGSFPPGSPWLICCPGGGLGRHEV